MRRFVRLGEVTSSSCVRQFFQIRRLSWPSRSVDLQNAALASSPRLLPMAAGRRSRESGPSIVGRVRGPEALMARALCL